MVIKNKMTALVVISTLLWVVINVLGWTDHYLSGMLLGVVLMLMYMMMGAAKEGVLSKKLFGGMMIPWAVLWALSFILADYWSSAFAGGMPSFTILGFHPSYGAVIFLYWIGGMLTLTAGFIISRNEWLSEQDWDNFMKKINKIKAEEGAKK